MRNKKIDNFRRWREEMKKIGIIPNGYPPLKKSRKLAEYLGVVLGDGNISKFPRTERIIISCNSKNIGFIKRYSLFTEELFNKKPTVSKVWNANNVRISLYQKNISMRLEVPSGNRNNYKFKIPDWILKNNNYLISLLRGLYEAEGSLSIHAKTYTYNFQFRNVNQNLLKAVENGLRILGYHPEVRKDAIRLRKKIEVAKFKELIKFRIYQ